MPKRATVYVIHNDHKQSGCLISSLAPVNADVLLCRTADEVLAHPQTAGSSCLVIGLHSLESPIATLRRVRSKVPFLPIIGTCRDATVSFSVAAMKEGLQEFLEEPVDGSVLRACVHSALHRAVRLNHHWHEVAVATDQWKDLSDEEKTVARSLAAGDHVKEIAAKLDLSVRTVHYRRKRAMEKIGAKRTSELAKLAHAATLGDQAGIASRVIA